MNTYLYDGISALIKALIEISESHTGNEYTKRLIKEICNQYNIFPNIPDILDVDVVSSFKQLPKKQKAEFSYYILNSLRNSLKKNNITEDIQALIKIYIKALLTK